MRGLGIEASAVSRGIGSARTRFHTVDVIRKWMMGDFASAPHDGSDTSLQRELNRDLFSVSQEPDRGFGSVGAESITDRGESDLFDLLAVPPDQLIALFDSGDGGG